MNMLMGLVIPKKICLKSIGSSKLNEQLNLIVKIIKIWVSTRKKVVNFVD